MILNRYLDRYRIVRMGIFSLRKKKPAETNYTRMRRKKSNVNVYMRSRHYSRKKAKCNTCSFDVTLSVIFFWRFKLLIRLRRGALNSIPNEIGSMFVIVEEFRVIFDKWVKNHCNKTLLGQKWKKEALSAFRQIRHQK